MKVHFLFKSHFVVLDQLVIMAPMVEVTVGVIIRCNVLRSWSFLFKRVHRASILTIHLSSSRGHVFWKRKVGPLVFSFVAIHFTIHYLLVLRSRLALPDLRITSKTSAFSLVVHDWHAVLLHVRVDIKHVVHFLFSQAVSMVRKRPFFCASSTPILLWPSIHVSIEVLLFQFALKLILCSLIALVLLERSVHFSSILLFRLTYWIIPPLLPIFFIHHWSSCSLIKSKNISLPNSHGLLMLRLTLQEATLLLETVIISRIRS